MTLEEAVRKSLVTSVKRLMEKSYTIGYESAKNEIVHCKDCRWWKTLGCAMQTIEERGIPEESDYCSYAEREEE